jgi:DNA-binding transcriptional regulator YbjK
LYIAANVDSLKVEAVEELKTDVAKRLASYRADLDKAEAKMMGIIAKL